MRLSTLLAAVAGLLVGLAFARTAPTRAAPGGVECPAVPLERSSPAGAPPRVAPPNTAPDAESPPVVLEEDGIGDDFTPGLGDAPVPWPDGLPAELRPEAMAVSLRKLATECGFDAHLVDVDCSEPPCLLELAVPDDGSGGSAVAVSPSGCRAWADRYGTAATTSNTARLCTDGSTVEVVQFGPYLPELAPDPADAGSKTRFRRLMARQQALEDRVGCKAPTVLRVENRVGYRLQWVSP